MRFPACGTIAEWNFSLPARDWRHWKNMMPSAPRAIACMLSAAIWPGALGALVGRQLRALVACSMRIHGVSGLSERIRSRANAEARNDSGSLGSG